MVKKKFNVKIYVFSLMAVGLGGIVAGYIMMANSAAYVAARTFLINSPKVIESLGPIQSSRLGLNFNLQYRGGGSAKIQVVLSGQRKSADAFLTLDMDDGIWRVKSGNLLVDGEDPIALLPETK